MKRYSSIGFVILAGLLLILVLPLASGKIYKQFSTINLKIPCSYNGSFCSSSALCNMTIEYPNSSVMIDNADMDNSGNGMPSYTLPDATITGTYQFTVICCEAGYCSDYASDFEINKLGEELTTYAGIIYAIVLAVSIFIFCLSLWGALKIQWKNNRDEEGRIISINDVKYVKLVLAFTTYLIGIWIVFMSYGITDKYLLMNGAARFFYLVYATMLAFLFPIFVVMIVFMIVIVVQDKRIEKLIDRGLTAR